VAHGAQRQCVQDALSASEAALSQADASWEKGNSTAILHLHGNDAYVNYSGLVAALNVSDCPAGFQQALKNWAGVWSRYGAFISEANKFHAPWNTQWSDQRVTQQMCQFASELQSADQSLHDQAASVQVNETQRSWTANGCG